MALFHVNFFSDVLGMCAAMDVILPQTVQGKPDDPRKPVETAGIPTLYLLHGMSDDHTIWQRRTSIERYAAEYGVAVVMPETHLGWYTDMVHGLPYFTFVAEELPKICRSFFPQLSERREDTCVAGLSMGGFGALKCGLTHPQTFGKIGALSFALVTDLAEHEVVLRNPHVFEAAFGDLGNLQGGENDLYHLAERCMTQDSPHPEAFLWCGTEDSLLPSARRYRDHLQAIGYPFVYSEGPGDHSWPYWDEQIRHVLHWMFPERLLQYRVF